MITLSYHIDGGDYDAAGLATRRLKEQLARVGVGAVAMRRAMIAAYEAEMNVVIHARTGTLWARVGNGRLDLEVADEGPGIPDVNLALREGWSTASARAREMGFGAGLGLPNIKRNSDLFEIETRVGRGTRIRSTILLEQAGPALPEAPQDMAPAVIDRDRCHGCMRCISACPTGALRVRASGPAFVSQLCVGCTTCAAECAEGVFSIADPDAMPAVSPDTVLIVPRGLLCGVPVPGGPAQVYAALHRLGFARVRFLEEWDDALRREAERAAGPSPVIPAMCPPVVALVESRFPSLISNLGSWVSPAEAAGEEFPLHPVVLVSACPGQAAAVRRSSLTSRLRVVAPRTLLHALQPLLSDTGGAPSEQAALRQADPSPVGTFRARGARHVLRALAEAEAGRLPDVSVLELALCDGGCSGSPYVTDDWCLSEQRWLGRTPLSDRDAGPPAGAVARSRPCVQRPGLRLDPDMAAAIRKLARIDALARTLPGRDCGACGAPTCAAFAEDVIMDRAGGESCPHVKEMQ